MTMSMSGSTISQLQRIWTTMSIPEPTILITTSVVGLIGIYLIYYFIYSLFFCPTRDIPGPVLTRFTNLYFIRLVLSGALSEEIVRLHKKYGPVLRLSPTKVDVQFPEVTIQGWGGQNERKQPWDKDAILSKMSRAGMEVDNIASVRSAQESKRFRRLMGPPYAKKYLIDNEQVFKDCIKRTLIKLDDLRTKNNNKVNVLYEYKEHALDVITEFGFGGYFKGSSSRSGRTELELMQQSSIANLFSHYFPTIAAVLRNIPWSKLNWIRSTRKLIQICDQSIREYKSKVTPGSRKDSLAPLLASKDNESPLSHDEIISASVILLFAGIETTASALTYLSYALAKYPEFQAQLAEELSDYSDVDSLNSAALEKLPLLNAMIREALRYWPPTSIPLPRLSPSQGVSIGEYHIPGGIQVSRAALAACRDPNIFHDPEKFDPQRYFDPMHIADISWIGLSREEETKMWDQNMIFSYGPRVCLGKEMALMEIRMLISAMILSYTWSGVPDEPGKWDEEMRPFDSLIVCPWKKKCVLELIPRS